MPTLHQLQQDFITCLKSEATDRLLACIQPNKRVSSATQFSLYQNSVIGNLQKALKSIFPVCYKLVGPEFFFAMATLYINQTPSYSQDINNYGATFAEFISEFPPAQDIPYLADVAKLEWAWSRALMAALTSVFNIEKLTEHSTHDSENILFLLPANSTLLCSPYPIHLIWETNQDHYTGETEITLEADQAYYYLVWQKHGEMHIDILSASQWQILRWIEERHTLGELCELTETTLGDVNITETLPALIQRGWIADFIPSCKRHTHPVSDTSNNQTIL